MEFRNSEKEKKNCYEAKARGKKRKEIKKVYVNIHLKAVNENALIWSFAHLVVVFFFSLLIEA